MPLPAIREVRFHTTLNMQSHASLTTTSKLLGQFDHRRSSKLFGCRNTCIKSCPLMIRGACTVVQRYYTAHTLRKFPLGLNTQAWNPSNSWKCVFKFYIWTWKSVITALSSDQISAAAVSNNYIYLNLLHLRMNEAERYTCKQSTCLHPNSSAQSHQQVEQ